MPPPAEAGGGIPLAGRPNRLINDQIDSTVSRPRCKRKTANVRLRFMFHYCISPERRRINPALVRRCGSAPPGPPLEKSFDERRASATVSFRNLLFVLLQYRPRQAM